MQVSVLDSRMAEYHKRRINTPKHRHWQMAVQTASCLL